MICVHVAAQVTRSKIIGYTEAEVNGGSTWENCTNKCAHVDNTSEGLGYTRRPTNELCLKRAITVGAVLLIFVLGVCFRVATKPDKPSLPTSISTVGPTFNPFTVMVNGTAMPY